MPNRIHEKDLRVDVDDLVNEMHFKSTATPQENFEFYERPSNPYKDKEVPHDEYNARGRQIDVVCGGQVVEKRRNSRKSKSR